MTKVEIDVFDPKSIQKAIDITNKWAKAFNERNVQKFLQRMGELGCTKASEKFHDPSNDYAGFIGDVSVTVETRGNEEVAVVATGPMVLVLEFGSGVYYPDSHPEAGTTGMLHGTYPGKGLGKQRTWAYKGDTAGTTGWPKKNSNGEPVPGMYLTHGNPGNMCMYLTVVELQQEIQRIAREVFEID